MADGEVGMDPIDYFMGIFVGMCIGLAGLAFVSAI
jgi:hypothetical protein